MKLLILNETPNFIFGVLQPVFIHLLPRKHRAFHEEVVVLACGSRVELLGGPRREVVELGHRSLVGGLHVEHPRNLGVGHGVTQVVGLLHLLLLVRASRDVATYTSSILPVYLDPSCQSLAAGLSAEC